MDLFGDAAAILNPIVSNSYYGMLRRQITLYLPLILCDIEEVYGLECLIKEPTRITENSSTLLQMFF